ncbi:hypothetical protein NXV57_15030 [Bacteroides thetaiotaomicron]|nr:hypothetical protein [Bacteroides thetaiotaomicron]
MLSLQQQKKQPVHFRLTARDFVLAFTNLVNTKTEEATGAISEAKKSAESSLKMTAEQLDLQFKKTVEEKTEEATGAITDKKESAESDIQASAEELTATFNKNAEEKVKEADGAITTSKNAAKSEVELTAKNLTATFEENVQKKTISAKGEIDVTTESCKSELNLTAERLTTKFEEAVADAEGDIIKEIGTQVTQNAKEWKVEVMGTDKDGNPNTILAAINADESGIKIEGERVQISGQLLVEAIMTTGINIDNKFIVSIENGKAKVTVNGEINATSGTFSGFLKIPFKTFKEGAIPNAATGEYTVSDYFNLEAKGEDTATRLTLNLPTDEKYIGTVLTVYDNPVKTRIAPIVEIIGKMYHPLNVDVYGLKLVTKIETGKGGVIQFIGVSRYDGCVWYVITDSLGESTRT